MPFEKPLIFKPDWHMPVQPKAFTHHCHCGRAMSECLGKDDHEMLCPEYHESPVRADNDLEGSKCSTCRKMASKRIALYKEVAQLLHNVLTARSMPRGTENEITPVPKRRGSYNPGGTKQDKKARQTERNRRRVGVPSLENLTQLVTDILEPSLATKGPELSEVDATCRLKSTWSASLLQQDCVRRAILGEPKKEPDVAQVQQWLADMGVASTAGESADTQKAFTELEHKLMETEETRANTERETRKRRLNYLNWFINRNG